LYKKSPEQIRQNFDQYYIQPRNTNDTDKTKTAKSPRIRQYCLQAGSYILDTTAVGLRGRRGEFALHCPDVASLPNRSSLSSIGSYLFYWHNVRSSTCGATQAGYCRPFRVYGGRAVGSADSDCSGK
jgi:hypothetical protein